MCAGAGLRMVIAMATDTSLSPRVQELLTSVDHTTQCTDDIMDDELTIDCVKLRRHFGEGEKYLNRTHTI